MLFTACDNEYGTSTEVVDSNANDNVNPAHLNDYKKPGTAGYKEVSTATPQQDMPADRIVVAYYTENKPEEFYKSERYTFSSTQQMGGRAADTTMQNSNTVENNTQATGMAPGAPASGESVGATKKETTTKAEKSKKERKTPYEEQ